MSTGTLSTQPRKPKGIPVGGQFDTQAHGESSVALGADPDADSGAQEDIPERAFAGAPAAFTAKYTDVADKIAAFKAELDSAVENLASDENWLNYCRTMSQFHRYSFSNQMLIHLQTQGRATRVAGFRAWQEKFGRTVNKGEKAIGILAPKTAWVAKRDPETKKPVMKDGKAVKEKRIVGWTTAAVFDVEQTSGPDLPSLDVELNEAPPQGFVADMQAAAEKAGYTVEFRKMDSHRAGTAQGWTDPKNRQIVVDADLSDGSQAATLAHELGHVYAGHVEPDEMGKYHVGDGGCRGRMEVEAESIAYGLTRANGMSMDGSKLSAQYVAGWSRHDKDALRESAETIAKSTKKILDAVPFRNLAE